MNNVYITSSPNKSRYFIEVLINTSKIQTRYITLNGNSRNIFNRNVSTLNDEYILKIIKNKNLFYEK